MINYPYEKGEDVVKLVLAILDCLGLIFLSFVTTLLLKESDFVISDFDPVILFIFVFGFVGIFFVNIICIIAIISTKNNRLKKIQTIMNSGYRTNGSVISIERYKYYPSKSVYWMVVQFIDRDGIMKKFKTPALALLPKEGYQITCDVFIYNNVVYAYNFMNFYVKLNDSKWDRIIMLIMLILCILLSILMSIGIFLS